MSNLKNPLLEPTPELRSLLVSRLQPTASRLPPPGARAKTVTKAATHDDGFRPACRLQPPPFLARAKRGRQNTTKHDKRIARKAMERGIHERISGIQSYDFALHYFVLRFPGRPDFCTMKSNSKLYHGTLGKCLPNSQQIDHERVAPEHRVGRIILVKKRGSPLFSME